MHAEGARALYSAGLPFRPRGALAWRRRKLIVNGRSFGASATARSTGTETPPSNGSGGSSPSNDSADANGAGEQNGDGNHKAGAADSGRVKANEAGGDKQDAESTVEALKSKGYGSARARATRSRAADDLPPTKLPAFFKPNHVSLCDDGSRQFRTHRPWFAPSPPADDDPRDSITRWETLRGLLEADYKDRPPKVDPGYRNAKALEWALGCAEWSDARISQARDAMRETDLGPIERRTRLMSELMTDVVLSALFDYSRTSSVGGDSNAAPPPQGEPSGRPTEQLEDQRQKQEDYIPAREVLRLHDPLLLHIFETMEDITTTGMGPDARTVLEREVNEMIRGSALMSWGRPERAMARELLATVQAGLRVEARAVGRKDAQRSVPLLAVTNFESSSISNRIVSQVAADVKADIIRLDARSLGYMVGRYLGEDLWLARGPFSMLGYAAGKMNGRIEAEDGSNQESLFGQMESSVPSKQSVKNISRVFQFLDPKPKKKGTGQALEDRWDDLKLTAILEEMTHAVDNNWAGRRNRNLIVHIDDFVELSSLPEGIPIVNRLRKIVDRMWQDGRRAMIVGSSTAPAEKWRSWAASQEFDELTSTTDMINFIASRGSKKLGAWKRKSFVSENFKNLALMLSSLPKPAGLKPESDKFRRHMLDWSLGVADLPTVYRLVSHLCSLEPPPDQSGDKPRVFTFDDVWTAHSRMRRAAGTLHDLMEKEKGEAGTPRSAFPAISVPRGTRDTRGHGEQDAQKRTTVEPQNEHEANLLSGLVKASDIRTTFNDIIAPKETVDSLLALTSLSLQRPEAFSYGVLATERIPGCLLYGPPGTGKTLIAKAVAKESGASMLEVSGASIMDMYVGQSEKNVRALFSLARKMAPLVVFIDEADALLGDRHRRQHKTNLSTVNQFLREWDGLTEMKAFIMVATNRPFDLDEAVLRRLPRRVLLDLPLRDARLAILRVMLRDESLAHDVDLARLAALTELYSGSDLKNVCVAAAMAAVREELAASSASAAAAAAAAASAAATGGDGALPNNQPFARRVLAWRHFDLALREISASISEDMESLKAIKKFDDKFGSARVRKKRKTMGFGVLPGLQETKDAMIRTGEATAPPPSP